jgi:hypothetical protein
VKVRLAAFTLKQLSRPPLTSLKPLVSRMSYSPETKRLWRWIGVIAVVGVLVAAGLWVYFVRAREDARRRRVIAANEREAALVVDGVAAAQQIHLEARGEYGTFPQLVEANVLQAPALSGERLVAYGYSFDLRVTPRAEGRPPAFALNADPVRDRGPDATGRRHFYAGSDVTGVRFHEERAATAADPLLPRRTDGL